MPLTIGALAATTLLAGGLWLAPWTPEATLVTWEDGASAEYATLREQLSDHLATVRSEEETVALAHRLAEEGRRDEAAALLEYLQVRDPKSPRAPSFQRQVVALWADALDREWSATKALISRYGPGSPWADVNPGVVDLEADLRRVATRLHASRAAPAAEAYTLWLDRFAGAEAEHAVRYGYAELLYDQERYDDAWQQYTAVATRFPDSPHARFCAESAVRAADALVAAAPGGEMDARLLASVDAYAAAWPDDERTTVVLYKGAYLLYARERYAEAEARFDDVVERAPESHEAAYGADLIVDGYVRRKDWAEAEAAAARYGERLDDDELRETAALAGYQRLDEADLAEGDAAAAWLGWAKRYPDAPQRDEILANVSAYYASIGDAERETEVDAMRE